MPIWLRSSLTSIVAGAAARSADLGGKAGSEAGEVYKAAAENPSKRRSIASMIRLPSRNPEKMGLSRRLSCIPARVHLRTLCAGSVLDKDLLESGPPHGEMRLSATCDRRIGA